MKRYLLILFSFTLFLAACHKDDEPYNKKGEGKIVEAQRTVLVYMVAENSLGANNCHRSDSVEIMAGRRYLQDDQRMLVFRDAGGKSMLYRVSAKSDTPILLKEWDTDICSTNPERFAEVLETVKSVSPAKEYGLVMWSHADGWLPPTNTNYDSYETARTLSFGIDCGNSAWRSNSGASMSVEDMAAAIDRVGMHCKFIFFDACLMQNVEVGYALRNVTDYLIASPAPTPGAGCYYTHAMQQGFFSADPADIARTYLADVQSDSLQNSYEDMGLCIACVKPAAYEQLAAVLQEALPASSLAGKNLPDVQNVLNYQPYCSTYNYRPHNYDALQTLRKILTEEDFARAKAALNAAIVYRGATSKVWVGPGYYTYYDIPTETGDYCSVSMFVPQSSYTQNASRCKHGDLNLLFQQTAWYAAAGFAATGW